MSKPPRGRLFFANPGPTNIPDSVLRAVSHHAVDFQDPKFGKIYDECVAGVKRVLKTQQYLFIHRLRPRRLGSDIGKPVFRRRPAADPGDRQFLGKLGPHGQNLGLEVQTVPCEWRRGVEISAIRAALAADTAHAIKGLCVVHNETSTGMFLPVDQVRAVLDETKHPALLLVDTISSLASLDFRMDEWGVDTVVGASQKGLMLPTGMSFTGVSEKAMVAHQNSKLPKHYLSWTVMQGRKQQSFIGTVPANFFFGLAESLRLIEEEGLENVFIRHSRLAEAVRRCVRHWSGNNGPQLYCANPARESNSVTAVLMPEGNDAEAVRKTCKEKFNVSLGGVCRS